MARTEDFSAGEFVQIGFKLLADSRGGPGADLALPVGRKAQIFQKKRTLHGIEKFFCHWRVGRAPPRSTIEVPYRSNFFHFLAVFEKKRTNNSFTCPPLELDPPGEILNPPLYIFLFFANCTQNH